MATYSTQSVGGAGAGTGAGAQSRRPFIKDLNNIDWKLNENSVILNTPARIVTYRRDKVCYSFNFLVLSELYSLSGDSDNLVVCGFRVSNRDGSPPGSDDETSPSFSVFLRNENSLFGIPGDFTFARFGKWDRFTWPLPVSFLLDINPSVHIELSSPNRDLFDSGQLNQVPLVELYLMRVADLTTRTNLVFTILNFGKPNITHIYQRHFGLFNCNYFNETVPGPFKLIPSWGIIRLGWNDTQREHPSTSLDVLNYCSNEIWAQPNPLSS